MARSDASKSPRKRRPLISGWVTQVAQSSYGHRARKLTWLYYHGAGAPPLLIWSTAPHTARLSYLQNRGPRKVEVMHARERSATPLPFRDLLLTLAALSRNASATAQPILGNCSERNPHVS